VAHNKFNNTNKNKPTNELLFLCDRCQTKKKKEKMYIGNFEVICFKQNSTKKKLFYKTFFLNFYSKKYMNNYTVGENAYLYNRAYFLFLNL
jgi:hypothetical protein